MGTTEGFGSRCIVAGAFFGFEEHSEFEKEIGSRGGPADKIKGQGDFTEDDHNVWSAGVKDIVSG